MAQQHPHGRQGNLGFPIVEGQWEGGSATVPSGFRTGSGDEMFVFDQALPTFLKGTRSGWVLGVAKLLREIDMGSFIAAYSSHAGQPPLHPVLMLGLVVYGFIIGANSLRSLQALAQTDLAAIYLCGGLRPDHSTIGRFLVRHTDVLTNEFFVKLTTLIVKKMGRQIGTVAGDGTVVEAAGSRFAMAKAEAIKLAAVEAAAYAAANPDDEKSQMRAKSMTVAAQTATERQATRKANGASGDPTLMTTEPDAVVQPLKQGPIRGAYKPSILANEDRLIVGQHLHPSNEVTSLDKTLEHHEQIMGGPPKTALLDAGFHKADVLQKAVDAGIDVLAPSGRESTPGMEKESKTISKEQFTYDPTTNVYRCPQNKLLAQVHDHTGVDPYRRYRCDDCEGCPQRAKCTTSSAGRTIRRFPVDEIKEAMREVLKQPAARNAYSRRKAIVEPVFSVLRGCQGMNRFLRKGLRGVSMEFAVHCIAYNIRAAVRHAARAARRLALPLAPHCPSRSPVGRPGALATQRDPLGLSVTTFQALPGV